MIYVADFETTPGPDDTRVWLWGLMDLNGKWVWGEDLNEFCRIVKSKYKPTIYFHNLRFDGTFLLIHLLSNGYVYSEDNVLTDKELNTMISDDGKFYQIRYRDGNTEVKLLDSLKIIPIPLKGFTKAFGITVTKGELDYSKEHELGGNVSEGDLDYLYRDLELLRGGILNMKKHEMMKMTVGANALGWYRKKLGNKTMDAYFPKLPDEVDTFIRKSYRGGASMVKSGIENRIVGPGVVYDKNSMYPWVMRTKLLPYDQPIYYEGEYVPDKEFPLYVQRLECRFRLKQGYLPTLQVKNNMYFSPVQYLTTSETVIDGKLVDEPVLLTLTNIDMVMLFSHYEILEITYHDGFKLRGQYGMFDFYVDHWYNQKRESKETGNKGLEYISKMMLNNLYGKFGVRPLTGKKIPYVDNGVLRFHTIRNIPRKGLYVPVAAYVTAYARQSVITAAQENYGLFCYMDTDSLHLLDGEYKGLDIDDYKLGAWKEESKFDIAKFIRSKTYLELFHVKPKFMLKIFNRRIIMYGYSGRVKSRFKKAIRFGKEIINVKCAGMPASVHKQVNMGNFTVGAEYQGKLQAKNVKGGQVLLETTFKIKS